MALRRHWAEVLGPRASPCLLDTKPVPVVGYKRAKNRSEFAATADYGVCASRNLKYFGYKLVLLCTPAGCRPPTTWYRPRRTSGCRGSRCWTGCGRPASQACSNSRQGLGQHCYGAFNLAYSLALPGEGADYPEVAQVHADIEARTRATGKRMSWDYFVETDQAEMLRLAGREFVRINQDTAFLN